MISFRMLQGCRMWLVSCLLLTACSSQSDDQYALMEVHSLKPILDQGGIAIILAEKSGHAFLPLVVDENQALSIYLGQTNHAGQRPLTHDLLTDVVHALGASLEKVRITDLRENIYYAELQLRRGNTITKIDARPSDAIALALRSNAPVFAARRLLSSEQAGENTGDRLSQIRVNSWGLTVQALIGELRTFFHGQQGVLITAIELNSPAQAAHLRPGDLIRTINGEPVATLAAFSKLIAEKSDGMKLDFEILREDSTQHIIVSKHN